MATSKNTKDDKKILRKKDIAARLVSKFSQNGVSMTIAKAQQFIDFFGQIAMESLTENCDIAIHGFIKLETRKRSARKIYDPQAKAFKEKPPSTVATIALSNSFKDKFKESIK